MRQARSAKRPRCALARRRRRQRHRCGCARLAATRRLPPRKRALTAATSSPSSTTSRPAIPAARTAAWRRAHALCAHLEAASCTQCLVGLQCRQDWPPPLPGRAGLSAACRLTTTHARRLAAALAHRRSDDQHRLVARAAAKRGTIQHELRPLRRRSAPWVHAQRAGVDQPCAIAGRLLRPCGLPSAGEAAGRARGGGARGQGGAARRLPIGATCGCNSHVVP